jgi:pseudouridine kinase
LKALVKSVNGAGDGLAAGTIHGLALGRTLLEAVLFGLAAAAIAIESEATVSPELRPALVAARIGAGAGAA